MKDMLAATKDTKQISAEQNSTCISQDTLQTRKKLRCSSRVSLNEENKLVCPEMNPEHRNSLESFDKNKNLGVSSNMKNDTLLNAVNPMLCPVISTVNEAKTPNKNECVATGEQNPSKPLKHFKKAYLAFDISIKKKEKIDQTDPSAATASKSNESLTSSVPEISQGKECEQQCNPYESVVTPTPEEIKFKQAAVKCNVLAMLPFNSKKQKRKEICLTNSIASEPMNNRLVIEEVFLEKRILLTNSDKVPSQETVSLSMEEKEHPTTVISESVPGVQKITEVQETICSAKTQSVQESISVYKPAAVTLNSTNITDNKNTQLKVVSLSENICTNLNDTTHDSTTLNKSTEVNLNETQQAKVLNTKNSDKSVPQLYFYPTLKQPLYKLQFSDKCENSALLSSQQYNYPYNCYYFAKKLESISIPKKTGKRRTKLKKIRNQIRPKEIRIAPKISCETAVSLNNINMYTEPLCSGTNMQPENNANKKPISLLMHVNFNETSCPLILPLAEQTKELPVIQPVQEYSDIKIIDVRTDIGNKQGVTGVSSSTDDIVQVKPVSTMISKSTNDLLQIQSPEIKIVGTPKNMNGIQIPSSEMDTTNQDSNPSKVPDSADVESSISELIDLKSKVHQVEGQMPQTVPETTQRQKSNPWVVEQDKMMPSAMKNMLNATKARQRNRRNRTVSENQKLMLLKKEALQKSRIDMLQNVFQVLNHCARMCASEDFEIWFKREESPTEQGLKDVQSQQEITHTITEKPGEWLDLLHVLKVEPVSENKTPKQKKSSETVTRPTRNCKRPKVAACGSVQKRKSNLVNDTTVADLRGTSYKNRKYEPNDVVMIKRSSSVVVDLEDVQSQQEVTHTLTENSGETFGLLKVLKVEPVSENKRRKRRKSSKRLPQPKRKYKKPEVAACGSVHERKSNLDDDALVADLPETSSKIIKVEPNDLVMIESPSNVAVDLEDVQSQQEITHTVTEKPRAWFDLLNELQVEPVSKNKPSKRRRSSMTVTQPTRNCKRPKVAACGSVQERKSHLDDDATAADLPETSSKIIKVEPDDLVLIERSPSVVIDLEDVQSQQEVIHTLTENPGECVGLLKVLKVEPVSENKTPKRRRSSMTVTQPTRNCKRPEVAVCGSVQERKSHLDDDATAADLPETSSKIIKVEPDDLVLIERSPSVVIDLKDVQSQQEVIHTLTENHGECVGLLKVLKVERISENETPKRRSKTVTQRKRNCKIPEVAVCGSVQKRKLNLDDDATAADLPETSSTIRKVEPNDLVMIESSPSVVSSNEPVGNLAPATTEVQEVSFMTHNDINLSEDVLEHGLETWKTDIINGSQICKSLRRRKIVPETYKITRPYKKHKISTHVRKKLKSSRKWITDSLKNGESKFIFTEDVIVKSEDIETKPDVGNYDIWNDVILCQKFGIQECYVRLRKVEDLYPSGYTCIDFDAIFS
ncbi:uncharacterized protein LOC107263867 isoform X2 [Cephus cinctus]|uniref:Uncharacterized protein LOC107263867 isoform X2 n=1 Tax=Cephus cinctus TaxID=211228 RepID=A0AAJ7RA77_CEPCN|nr:uncharacterized protein LOC107263867 isoform X2 [Cephus cinctus]